MGEVSIGLDVGGTKVLGLVVDPADGTVLAEHRVPTPAGGAELLAVLVDLSRRLGSDTGLVASAVGVGAAGLVDAAGVLRYGPNLPGIVDLDLAGELTSRLGVPVRVDNDATAGTVAEHRLGAARTFDDAVYVALGTGIGGGLVVGGDVRRGANGFGGEIGHMVVDPRGPRCPCGLTGCWERRASGSALGDQARAAVAAGEAPGIAAIAAASGADPTSVSGEHAVAAAAAGDVGGVAVLAGFARWIAVGLAGLVNALDPAVVVVGGGVVEAGDVLMRPLRAAVDELLVGAAHRPRVEIVPAHFGEHAVAVGAALLAAETAATGPTSTAR